MRRHLHRRLPSSSFVVAAAVLVSACMDESGDAFEPPEVVPWLTAGIDADPALLARVAHTEVQIESPLGTVIDELETAEPLPLEVPIPDVEERELLRVTVWIYDDEGNLILERMARTSQSRERQALLRMRLNDECVPGVTGRDVECPTETCIAGFCANAHVIESELEDYREDWAEPPTGDCIDEVGAEPMIEIGNDGESFVRMDPGTRHEPEWGIQGGTHIWFAVRVNNLAPEGTTTAMTLDPEGGFGTVQKTDDLYEVGADGCVLQHVRYIIPSEDTYDTDMRLVVSVADYTGNAAQTSVDMHITEAPPPPF